MHKVKFKKFLSLAFIVIEILPVAYGVNPTQTQNSGPISSYSSICWRKVKNCWNWISEILGFCSGSSGKKESESNLKVESANNANQVKIDYKMESKETFKLNIEKDSVQNEVEVKKLDLKSELDKSSSEEKISDDKCEIKQSDSKNDGKEKNNSSVDVLPKKTEVNFRDMECKKFKKHVKKKPLIKKRGVPNINDLSHVSASIQQLYSVKSVKRVVMNCNSENLKFKSLKYLFRYIEGKEKYDIGKIKGAVENICLNGECPYCISEIYDLLRKFPYNSYIKIEKSIDDFSWRKFCLNNPDSCGSVHEIFEEHPLVFPVCEQFCFVIERFDFKSGNRITKNNLKYVTQTIDYREKKYNLAGVIAVFGDEIFGSHCVSYKMDNDGKWYLFDGTEVKEVPWEEVKENAEVNGVFLRYDAVDTESE